ncbi:hypothetical protein CMV_030416 [Castanea mollissima]|uniref:Phytoene synthase n=1 Tax=Castanea mollissima TaxID=60419 RepID=A0A8J4V352_9ROSI|nr:hypothetical protein CMV_030416 [Castanea mollissima]
MGRVFHSLTSRFSSYGTPFPVWRNYSGNLMNGASASCSLRSAFSYCVRQVCSYDYHHYLCLLELPPPMRKVAFALHAFNVETARAVYVASDPRIGLMRLIWWQEAIDKMSTAADHAASHIGKDGLLAKEGGQSEIGLDSLEHLCDAVFDMTSVANIQLQKAREPAGTVPAEAHPLLLQVVLAQVLLDSLSQISRGVGSIYDLPRDFTL